ncbi:acyl-CoA dehydrogenase family protein [Microbacterium sp.]|uniref:acyl-CoA dehydrogenase family protein n=1 Tax=Microbacterium sp. TaxID=51671 RepID=UPI003F730282
MFQPISADLSPVFARFVDERSPVDVSRRGGAERPPLWSALVEEVGAAGLLVSEEHGGQGASLTELAAAVAETARCGWSGPLVATAGATVDLLQTADPDDESGLLTEIAESGRIVVTAFHEDARGSLLDVATTLTGAPGAQRVDGRKTFVDSGTHADVLLVPALDDAGTLVLARVDPAGPGVTITALESVDPGRGLATIDLTAAPAEVVVTGPDLTSALHDAWLTGALLTGVDLLSAGIRAFTLARDYSLVREQFGRPVATFQSVKHNLVDMYGELQTAYSAVATAIALGRPADPDSWRFGASAAKARAGDAAMRVLRESVQVHGGIGFTWEHEVSHHFRRVVTGRAMYGTPTRHRALVAAIRGF